MDYLIRPAAEKDIPSVYNFICLLEETNFDYTAFETCCKENINNSHCVYLVAASNTGGIIGFISCHMQNLLHHAGTVAEIQELFVAENFRGMGIGNRLVEETEKKILASGCVSFEVTAQNKRTATHRFYERAGFAATHKKMVKQPGRQ